MTRRREPRLFSVVVKYATEPSAPTLEQVQAQAAPLIAQLLAQMLAKRLEQKVA